MMTCTRALTPHLNTGVAEQVEIKLSRVTDADVHSCTGWLNVSTLSNAVFLIATEQSRVMTFLNRDEGDARLVANLQHRTRFTNGSEFI